MVQAGLRILIVDDERPIRRFLKTSLAAHGYIVIEASGGKEALLGAAEENPDLVLLDLGLPDMDGIEVTQRIREWSEVPIIILSVRNQETEKIAALDAGADDYLTKPFGMGELMARMRGVLRRVSRPEEDNPSFRTKNLIVNLSTRQVLAQGQEISLTPTEYEILKLLVRNAGKVLTHRQIIREVWGTGYDEESHLLRVNVSNLRRKIEPEPTHPQIIITEVGVGYRLRNDEEKALEKQDW